jgi:hypothetical protein
MSNTSITPGTLGRAVPTPGNGKRTTAHLNLTRSLADVGWPKRKHPSKMLDDAPFARREWDREHQPRIRYAGAEF